MPKGDTSDLPEGCIANILSFTWAQDVCPSSLVSKMFKSFKMPKEDIPFLPEECVANILSFTSPQDACISSLVSKMFKSAADSDLVWEKFLPGDYKQTVAHLKGIRFKKELYFRYIREYCPAPRHAYGINTISRSINGKECIIIGEDLLSISWAKDTKWLYWDWEYKKVSWVSTKSGRTNIFNNVPMLLAVRWLHITGRIHTHLLSPKTLHEVYLVFELTGKTFGLDRAEACVSFVKGEGRASGSCTVCLDPKLKGGVRFVDKLRSSLSALMRREKRVHFPSRRVGFWKRRSWTSERGTFRSIISWQNEGYCPSGWMEVKMGEFYNADREGEVRVTLSEVKKLNWKGGLIVQGIEVRPKEKQE